MKNTTQVGNRSLGSVIGSLVKAGLPVLIPVTEGLRYDLVIEREGKLLRVQSKTAFVSKGCIVFNTQSSTGGKYKPYTDIDLFGVYCAANDKVYLVPVAICGKAQCSLRLDPLIRSHKDTRWASKFEI